MARSLPRCSSTLWTISFTHFQFPYLSYTENLENDKKKDETATKAQKILPLSSTAFTHNTNTVSFFLSLQISFYSYHLISFHFTNLFILLFSNSHHPTLQHNPLFLLSCLSGWAVGCLSRTTEWWNSNDLMMINWMCTMTDNVKWHGLVFILLASTSIWVWSMWLDLLCF